ncbi:hypothetical protein BGW42_006288 [Actinomortierella wolfii]|nr:hypothetical protein BGW42_006288 [Actinomortierella wolfii]
MFWFLELVVVDDYTKLAQATGVLKTTVRHILGRTPKEQGLLASLTIVVLRLVMGGKVLPIHHARKMLKLCGAGGRIKSGLLTEKARAQWAHPVAYPGQWRGYWIPYREQKLKGPVPKIATADVGTGCDIVMLAFHGGGMVMGDALLWLPNYKQWIKLMKEKHGIKLGILTIEYSLSPEARYPVAIEECVAAYRYLVQVQGVDPRRIVMCGDSAGANLCLSTGLRIRDEYPQLGLPAGQVLYSPWVISPEPLKDSADDYIVASGEDYFLHAYAEGQAKNLASHYAGSSPMSAQTFAGLPRMLCYVGGVESLRPSIEQFIAKAKADGVTIQVELKEGMPHDYALIEQISGSKVVQEADQIMAQFVAKIHGEFVGA